ncbi:FMN-binding glutamate synthase family protein [Salinisphaera hydrothermalis]|uniref:Ferredoxin-dependent glutamate synthase n=1 Tax=Salinisphaera hydrothermalis (strain C41B8) TaxID=1304275 RepID=A0A084IKP0_SALHC|nr:FMN-binding glutamate synthase family protein [Salinisphaera hydrothermalis]KEZ77274.1 ferredoxin-dependent glutamate synthase [Salinisphaera hydrothermalis C41B8]
MFGYPRLIYAIYLLFTLAVGAVLAIFAPVWLWAWGVLLLLAVLGAFDLRSHHNVLRNFPVIGHLRYMMEFLRPELRQYFFESETSGRPFNREQREVIYKRARGEPDTSPFGTMRDFEDAGFSFSQHSMAPKTLDDKHARITIGNSQCSQPYSSSRLNISAMSFGSLSGNAVAAMNRGAKLGNFAQDTGEGAISDYHREHGGDLIWEIASAYFGCRHKDGSFNADEFAEKANTEQVKMIEIKISQGAKPAHGGLLPGKKVTAEIARVRDIEQGQDCQSPATHPEFDTPRGLLEFMQKLRELTHGKPVGFKLCLGHQYEFMGICKAMLETGITPDFITIDGAEGGTGAAPTEFEDFIGTYINEALPFVHNCLTGIGLRDDIVVIASGKVAMGYDMVVKIALGADMCNSARGFMFSTGCIQSRRCHTDTCPTGVATQDPRRAKALEVMSKSLQVRNFHDATIKSFMDITGALGVASPEELSPVHVYHRPEHGPAATYESMHPKVGSGDFLNDRVPEAYQRDWQRASADAF